MGKKVLIVLLVVLLAAGGYGFYWYNGLKTVDSSYVTAKSGPGELNQAYQEALTSAKSGKILIKGDSAEGVTQKLFTETSFFHLAKGSGANIESAIIGTKADKAEVRMVVDISKLTLMKNPKKTVYQGAAANIVFNNFAVNGFVMAPPGLSFIKADRFGVTAELELKVLPEGMGIRPTSIKIGSSIIPVGIAMSALKQYAPGVKVTSGGFIILEPMVVRENSTGKQLFTITGIEVKEGNLIINTK